VRHELDFYYNNQNEGARAVTSVIACESCLDFNRRIVFAVCLCCSVFLFASGDLCEPIFA
jgi:hypothetical protein